MFDSVVKEVKIIETREEFGLVVDTHLNVEEIVLGSSELPKISRVNHNQSGSSSRSHV